MPGSTWCSFAAFGSALIVCAVAAGTSLPIAIALVFVAALEIFWSLLTLRAGRIFAPRSVIAAGVCIVAAATVTLFAGEIGAIPFLALLALHWSAAVLAAIRVWRPRTGGSVPPSRPARPSVTITVMAVQAMLVAVLTTPALAETGPGEFALPHGVSHHH